MVFAYRGVGENLDDLRFGNAFINTTSKVYSMREKINKLDFVKIKMICSAKHTVKRMRRQVTVWEKVFSKDVFNRDLSTKHTKNV